MPKIALREVAMLTFERIILTMLVLGIWALVLTPPALVAHHQNDDGHSCDISGYAYGNIQDLSEGGRVRIRNWRRVSVDCTHY